MLCRFVCAPLLSLRVVPSQPSCTPTLDLHVLLLSTSMHPSISFACVCFCWNVTLAVILSPSPRPPSSAHVQRAPGQKRDHGGYVLYSPYNLYSLYNPPSNRRFVYSSLPSNSPLLAGSSWVSWQVHLGLFSLASLHV